MRMSNLMFPVSSIALYISIGITIGVILFLRSGEIKAILYNDKHLFYTHTPDGYQIGSVVEVPHHTAEMGWTHESNAMITRLVEVAPTATIYGGSSRCFEVRGR